MINNEIRIDLLGTSIAISADRDPEYLKKLLETYKDAIENVKKMSGLSDPLKIAILTGFLLCDDLEKREHDISVEDGEAEKRTLNMLTLLEEILAKEAD